MNVLAGLIIDAVVDKARNDTIGFLVSKQHTAPTMLFVGNLEHEALKTGNNAKIDRMPDSDDMILTLYFDKTTIQRVNKVILLIRHVPQEQTLIKVA